MLSACFCNCFVLKLTCFRRKPKHLECLTRTSTKIIDKVFFLSWNNIVQPRDISVGWIIHCAYSDVFFPCHDCTLCYLVYTNYRFSIIHGCCLLYQQCTQVLVVRINCKCLFLYWNEKEIFTNTVTHCGLFIPDKNRQ